MEDGTRPVRESADDGPRFGKPSVFAAMGRDPPRVRLREDTPTQGLPLTRAVAGGPDSERFSLVGEVGRGGMGVVPRVRDADLGRETTSAK